MADKSNKCAHPTCDCAAAQGSKFCSPACEASANRGESACNCGHAGCHARTFAGGGH